MNTFVRFLTKVKVTPGCWEWQAAKKADGYGMFYLDGRTMNAHRVAYLLFVEAIGDDLVVDHLCRNHGCVNPDHLEAVPQRINLLRGDTIAAKFAETTHCPQGHEYTESNTRVYRGSRYCRACKREKVWAK